MQTPICHRMCGRRVCTALLACFATEAPFVKDHIACYNFEYASCPGLRIYAFYLFLCYSKLATPPSVNVKLSGVCPLHMLRIDYIGNLRNAHMRPAKIAVALKPGGHFRRLDVQGRPPCSHREETPGCGKRWKASISMPTWFRRCRPSGLVHASLAPFGRLRTKEGRQFWQASAPQHCCI